LKVRKPIIPLICIFCLLLLAVAPQAAFGNFKIIVLPDTQNYSQYYPAIFNAQTQWIADNMSALNIAFVAHVGDVVNACNSETQYSNADAAMDLLDGDNVPYGISPGNHDQANSGICGSASLFPSYFGAFRYSERADYRGSYSGNPDYNHYFFFSAGGMEFIIIFLQYNPDSGVLAWAGNLLTANSERRGIVVSHAILNIDNSWLSIPSGQTIYNSLQNNPNLFLMLCGHMHSLTDGEALRTESREGMNPVYIILSDYQSMSLGNGWLRILEFDPSADQFTVTAYSPYILDTGSSFTLAYDMTTPVPGDLDEDCDVDGRDLAGWIAAGAPIGMDVEAFAGNYGRSTCQ